MRHTLLVASMRYALPTASLLAALALTGCGDDDRPSTTDGGSADGAARDGGPASPVAIDAFCAEFVDSVCDNVARCDCGPTADADCRAQLVTACSGAEGVLGPTVRARITAGTVSYDANAAGVVIAAVRAQTTCDNPILTVGWGFGDVLTFGGTLTGTLTPGTACTPTGSFGGECIQGICTDLGATPQCTGLAEIGASCGANILCADLDAPFTSFDSAAFLLRCNIAPGATVGVCAARLADGAVCTSAADCVSSRCEADVCVAPLANGATCGGSSDCASHYCRTVGASSTCAAAATVANGSACVDDQECVSGACTSDTCVAGICSTYSM